MGMQCAGKKCMGVKIACLLLTIGGLNWGLVGIGYFASGSGGSWNVVQMLFGKWAAGLALVYILVGLSAVMKIVGCRCSGCSKGSEGGTCK